MCAGMELQIAGTLPVGPGVRSRVWQLFPKLHVGFRGRKPLQLREQKTMLLVQVVHPCCDLLTLYICFVPLHVLCVMVSIVSPPGSRGCRPPGVHSTQVLPGSRAGHQARASAGVLPGRHTQPLASSSTLVTGGAAALHPIPVASSIPCSDGILQFDHAGHAYKSR